VGFHAKPRDSQTTYYTYDDDGRLSLQTTYGFDSPLALKETETDFSYDNTEVLIAYRVTGFEADGSTPRYRTFYYVDHHKADSYLAGNEVVNTQSENDPTVSGSLTRSYNGVKRNRKLTHICANVELKTDPPRDWVVSPDQAALSSFFWASLTTPRLPATAGRRPAWRLSLRR
jgi:hypothetical protein